MLFKQTISMMKTIFIENYFGNRVENAMKEEDTTGTKII